MRITVYGAGGWGTALARLLYNNGHDIQLWSWQEEHVREMLAEGENRQFLPGVPLPPGLKISSDPAVGARAELVLFSVPSSVLTEVATQAAPHIRPGAIIVNTAKGFLPGRHQRLSEMLRELLPGHEVVTLSGPSHAEEVGRELVTLVCVAGRDPAVLNRAQDAFINSYFRVYTNEDQIGVEVGGAVKNIIAVGAGVLAGLGQGDNAKAALMTRGLTEMKRLGLALGAQAETFAGLAGMGDMIATCTSLHSRNYRAGLAIGSGKLWRQVVAETNMVVEGVYATESTYALARHYQVEMPIVEQMYSLLYEDRSPQEAMWELMTRRRTDENW